jgi:L-lactate dehydrogenase complex protein LldE
MIVDIFIPCYMDQYYPETANNMVKVLEKIGCGVNYNVEQTCCGLPAFYDGYWDYSKEVGAKLIHEFPNDRHIVSPGGMCVNMIKNYYHYMFHNTVLHNEYKSIQKHIYEFTEFLFSVMNVTDLGARFNATVTYHDACNAVNDLKIKEAPRALLSKVKGLTLKEMYEPGSCCGLGGTFAGKFENLAAAIAEEKIKKALETDAEYIVSTDMGCLMHLESYLKKNNIPLKVMHIADMLVQGW